MRIATFSSLSYSENQQRRLLNFHGALDSAQRFGRHTSILRRNHVKIIAVDPGATTGVAWTDFSEEGIPELNTSMPKGFEAACTLFERFGGSPYRSNFDLLVIERFSITAKTVTKTREGSNLAIELIGVAKWVALQCGLKVEEQSPADAKNFASDAKLRKIGWYTPGPDHARDATRHLLLAAVRHKVLNPAHLI